MSLPFDRYGPALILLVALCLPPRSDGRTVSLVPAKDATLHETSELGSVANGAGEFLFAGRLGPNGAERIRRALMRFETGGRIPPGAQVTNAVLRLVMTKTSSDAASVALHTLNRDWGEGPSQSANGQGAPAQAGDATWYHAFFDTDLWALAGGDYTAEPSAVVTVVSNGIYTWSGPALERDVQTWIDYPALNHGWILLGNETSPGTVKRFASRESQTPALRPQLEISFRDPPPVEPVLFSSVLTPEQVLPASGHASAGIALVAFDPAANTLGVRLHHNAAAEAGRVRLYGPALPGETGPLVLDLGSSAGLITATNRLSDANAQALLNGRCYLRVEQNGTGVLRGQIGVEHEFSAVLDGSPTGSDSPFDGIAVFRVAHAAQQLHVTALHNVPDAPVLQLRAWDGSRPGPEALVPLAITNGLFSASVPLPPQEYSALVCGARSVAVVPAGQTEAVIAGHVEGIDPLPYYSYAALMSGALAVPAAENSFSGLAVAGYDPPTRRVHFELVHDVDSPLAAFLLGGAGPGTNGTVVLNLGTALPSMRGSAVLAVPDALDLQSGLLSASVHNSEFPAGAIKGQFEAADHFVCVMRGRDARPPVATSDGGAGIFRLDPGAQLLSYTVMHTAGTNAVLTLQSPGAGCGCCDRRLPGGGPLLAGAVSVCASFVDGLMRGDAWLSLAETALSPEYVRGWIQPARPVEVPTHVIEFSDQPGGITNETGAIGVAVMSLDCAAQILQCSIYHTAGTQALVRLDPGHGDESLPDIILDETAAEGVTYACLSLSSNLVNEVHAESLLAELAVEPGPAQTVPGRFVSDYNFAALLSGRGQEPVRTTTPAGGIGLFRYDEDSRRLDGIVLHPYGTNAVVSLVGLQGDSAGTFVPVPGGAHGHIVLTEEQAVSLVRRHMRVDISRNGLGLIRGRLARIQPDRDCDGVPDYWETAYGGQVDVYDRDSDLDLDGHSALEEFWAGTLPQEGSSVLGATAITNGSAVDVVFPSVVGRRYVLEYAADVRAAVWQEVSAARFGTGGLLGLSHTNAAFTGGVYRVRVRLP